MKLNTRNSLTLNTQQEQIMQNINELHEQNQIIIKEYMNKQQILQDQLQQHQSYITFQELKQALHNNVWTQKVGIFLNPLSNLNNITIQQQQTLLKHSESKLILIERIFQTESRITQFEEQKKMILNDIYGRTEQMDSLLIEYEELEQIIDSQQNKQQSIHIRQIIDINKQLNQLKLQYTSHANQRQSKDIKQQELQQSIAEFEQQLKQYIPEQQIKALQYPQFNKNESQYDLLTQSILLINEKLIQYFKTKNNQLLQNITQIEEQNNFKCFDVQIIHQVLDDYQIQEYSQFLISELPKRINRYKIELQLKANKTQLLEIQREIHQIMYDQSIIQCHYNRLESSLPLFDQNPIALKLQQILQRMNHIECLKSQNKTLFEITFPSQIKTISNSIQQTQTQLTQLINDLQYSIKIEQEFYHKLNKSNIQTQKLPILILDQMPPLNIELEMEEIRKNYQQSQQLYNQNIENLKQRLKQLQEKQTQRRYFAEMNESIQRKENIPPSDSRDQSLLGTIQIDMSQERTTHKYSVFRSRKQLFMNEATDRSLSTYSFLGHRASDPLLSKTKLTLKQQTSISSQTSQKNPLLSPKNHHISVEQSLSLHSSARRFPDLQKEVSPQQGDKIYKVLKRICRTQQVSAYSSKYVKLNGKMKCLEFYNSNRMLHDLGCKESALCLRQIKEMKIQKLALELIISKHQKIELVFSKQEQLIEFMKSISQ